MQPPDKEKEVNEHLSLSYWHQPYCWQVALQQSLCPLQADNTKFIIQCDKITNYF